jgi:hypothetical protein
MELTRSTTQSFDFDKGTTTTYLGQTDDGSFIYSGEALKVSEAQQRDPS